MQRPAEPPPAAEVPRQHGAVEARRVEGLAVRADRVAEAPAGVALKGLHGLRARRVPDPYAIVVAAGDREPAVGTEADVGPPAGMGRVAARLPSAAQVGEGH